MIHNPTILTENEKASVSSRFYPKASDDSVRVHNITNLSKTIVNTEPLILALTFPPLHKNFRQCRIRCKHPQVKSADNLIWKARVLANTSTSYWSWSQVITCVLKPCIYALSSAMDLRHLFSDNIFSGIKVVDTISKSKRLLMLSSCMVENCVEVLKRHVWICISFFYLTKQCRS
jgi:hypothetical protein